MNAQKGTYASHSNRPSYLFLTLIKTNSNILKLSDSSITNNCIYFFFFSYFGGIEIIASKCYHASGVITITVMFEVGDEML